MEFHFLFLLLAFEIKHLLADYYWQYAYMYENKGKLEGWLVPLTDHALIHASLTALIGLLYCAFTYPTVSGSPVAIVMIGLPIFDFVTHTLIDRWKAVQKHTPADTKFWTNLGIDQGLHHVVGYFIIFYLVACVG